jgi:hypothetical protein
MKNRVTRIGWAILLVLFGWTPIESLSESITFDDIARAALDRSPLVKEISADAMTAKAEAVELRTRANPELSGEIRPFVAGGEGADTEYEITLSQPLRLSSLTHRARVARLMERTATVEQKLQLHKFMQTVRLSYGKAWALQERRQFVAEASKRAEIFQHKAAEGLTKGVIPDSTVKLFSAEAAKLEAQQIGVGADEKRARAELVHMSGVSLKERTLAALLHAEISKTMLQTASDIPLKNRIELRRKVAYEQRALARLDSFPQFTPRVGFEHTESGDDRIVAGLSIELPFWNRNQVARMKTKSALESREVEASYYTDELFNEEKTLLFESLEASAAQAKRYTETILPALRNAFTAAVHEFDAGQANPLQIWQLHQELLDAQDEYLTLWIKTLSERVELSILLGNEL